MKTRLLLVDDHAVIRLGLKMLLENEADMEVVGEAENASQALAMAARLRPDVILLDIGLPDISGIEAAAQIKQLVPETMIVALTIHEDEEYFFQNVGSRGNRLRSQAGCPRRIADRHSRGCERGGLFLPLARQTARQRFSNPGKTSCRWG